MTEDRSGNPPLDKSSVSPSSRCQLAISRVQPLEDGRLGVWMDGVSDQALMAWLLALSREDGIRVDQISIDREGDQRVRTQMVLVRGGA